MSRTTLRLIAVSLLSIALGVGGTVAANRIKGPHNHMGTALYADCPECGATLRLFVGKMIEADKPPKAEPAGPPKPEAPQ